MVELISFSYDNIISLIGFDMNRYFGNQEISKDINGLV